MSPINDFPVLEEPTPTRPPYMAEASASAAEAASMPFGQPDDALASVFFRADDGFEVQISDVAPAASTHDRRSSDRRSDDDRGAGGASGRLGMHGALSLLVTDAIGTGGLDVPTIEGPSTVGSTIAGPPSVRPPLRSRATDGERKPGDVRHRALLRAIGELAETHAIAADLAYHDTAIDLALDVPDPTPDPVLESALIVPDMIRACRDRVAAHADVTDRNRMDTVATLFDHVLADDRLASGIRNTLARLQLPVLRMAMADESFFASRTHPTRRLLDRMATSAADWDLNTDSGRASLAELDRVVHAVIRGSFEDAGEHARLLEGFERAIIDIATTRSAKTVEPVPDSQDRDVLIIKATIQISQLLAGVEVDRAIRFFLLDVWSRVLVEIACSRPSAGTSDSSRDARLARAKRLCFDLAWTTAPKASSGDRARLAGLLPSMIAALRDGLRVIDFPEADEKRFFDDWSRVLHQAVGRAAGLPGRSRDGGIDEFARQLREGSFGPETMVPMAGLETASDATPSMLQPEAVGRSTPLSIGGLVKGEWFELDEPGGAMRVRLSWISPLRSFYLFVGADSALTRSFDPAAIGELIATGGLRRVASRERP